MKSVEFDPGDIQFSILSHSAEGPELGLYNNCFELWRKIWNLTFKELGDQKEVDADQFYLVDDICALHIGSEPVGLICVQRINLEHWAATRTSYFKSFPAEAANRLLNLGLRKVGGIGGLVVSPEFRGGKSNIPWSRLLVSLSSMCVFERGGNCTLTYTRNDRGVNRMFYELGGRALWDNLSRHNVEVDIIVTRKDDFHESERLDVRRLGHKLWEGRNPLRPKFTLESLA